MKALQLIRIDLASATLYLHLGRACAVESRRTWSGCRRLTTGMLNGNCTICSAGVALTVNHNARAPPTQFVPRISFKRATIMVNYHLTYRNRQTFKENVSLEAEHSDGYYLYAPVKKHSASPF